MPENSIKYAGKLDKNEPADVEIIVLGRDADHEEVILETTHLYTRYIQ